MDGTTNIMPAMTLESLRDGYKNILKNIYSPEAYYARVITFLREYNLPSNTNPWQIRRFSESLAALFRSILRLGILGKERFK